MKIKILGLLTVFLLSSVSHAAKPEIWWAIRVDCNVFMEYLSIHLEQKGSIDSNGIKSYVGSGYDNFDSLDFDSCRTLDADSISCTGKSNFGTNLKLTVARHKDGTFGSLFQRNGASPIKMGCLLTR